MNTHAHLLKVRSTKNNIGFSCTILSAHNKIEIQRNTPDFENFLKKTRYASYDNDSNQLIITSDTAGILLGKPGEYLIEGINGFYYPTTNAHLKIAINNLKNSNT